MSVRISREQKTRMLERMILIRHFELRVKQLYRAGEITGAIHLYIGQEAIATAGCENLRDDDYVTSTHRSHGHCIAKVKDLKRTMAEMMGRQDGLSHGHGGSMHMFDIAKGFLGGNGIVGGGIAIALGAAFAAAYERTDRVAVCFFSEGASNQGVLHECLNMAALWNLPVVYLCENNRYAATTPVEKSTCTVHIAPRAAAYDLPWSIADGNDALDVYRKVHEAVARARAGKGATFVECKTYRVEPHCGIIPDQRSGKEVDGWRGNKRDPITRLEERLLKDGIVSRKAVRGMHDKADRELDEAVEFARNSPFPRPETVGASLWAE